MDIREETPISHVSSCMKQLTLTTLVAGAAVSLLMSLSGPSAPTEDLLGASLEVLRSELGPPISVLATKDSMSLDYKDEAGEVVRGAILVADGVVVKSAPDLVRSTATGLEDSLLLATPLELIHVLGPASKLTQGASSSTIHFDEVVVDLVGGIAVSARKH